MNLLLLLTLRGSLMFFGIALLDRLFASAIRARSRRLWWMLVPLAFLLIVPGSVATPRFAAGFAQPWIGWAPFEERGPVARASILPLPGAGVVDARWVSAIIAVGAAAYLLAALVRTRSVLRRWGRERLSTDAQLLGTLEDCKAEARITAPLGLVVSEEIAAPAILGWLRPRILLPAATASSLSREQLRAVLFHELAHFRSLDIPLNWLFTLVCALNWFNPVAHLAFRAWTRFAEEAADESAIGWLRRPSSIAYGEALLHVLKQTNGRPVPFAAMAIVESASQLKKRITMIKHYEMKSPRYLLTGAILMAAAFVILLWPVAAGEAPDDPNTIANGPMLTWLQKIDDGKYAQSWDDAAPYFQKAVSSQGWVDKISRVRKPLGKCLSRKLASALRQTAPSGSGDISGNDLILAQFDTSFEGLKYAVETVSFVKTPDGAWKPAGYYIKPNV